MEPNWLFLFLSGGSCFGVLCNFFVNPLPAAASDPTIQHHDNAAIQQSRVAGP